MERYIKGKEFLLYSLFDGKNIFTRTEEGLSSKIIDDYSEKLKQMFCGETPNFIGYITSKVMLSDEKLYNLGFSLEFPIFAEDIIFVLVSAIYQKLNEL